MTKPAVGKTGPEKTGAGKTGPGKTGPRKAGPDDAIEAEARRRLGPAAEAAVICGVDEAGRGPLAGPVVAAAVTLLASAEATPALAALNDSKALKPAAREALFEALRAAQAAGLVDIGVGAASAREIDALNILRANDLAMRRAVARLASAPDYALIDGDRTPPNLGCAAEAVVKGDARVRSIAAASVVAKVIRDRAMARLAARHRGYGWDRNAGYPTAEHRAALAEHGPSKHHRTSFGSVKAARSKV